MTRPTQVIPRPATDATVSTGLPEAGLSTRLDPSTAITQGVIGGRKFGGRIMNWILGGFGDWIAYLDGQAIREVVLGTSVYINDDSITGSGPQIVNNTPRVVRDSGGNDLIMACSANAGERLNFHVGPLFVQPIYLPTTTPTVFVRATIMQGGTEIKHFTARYDAQSNPNLLKSPIDWDLSVVAPVTGSYALTLSAWALQLEDHVSILSPGLYGTVNDSMWPEEDVALQQWGRIVVTAA